MCNRFTCNTFIFHSQFRCQMIYGDNCGDVGSLNIDFSGIQDSETELREARCHVDKSCFCK